MPGTFQDFNGKYSSVRLASFTALIAAIFFGLLTMTVKESKSAGIYLTVSCLTAAFGTKTIQKFTEHK